MPWQCGCSSPQPPARADDDDEDDIDADDDHERRRPTREAAKGGKQLEPRRRRRDPAATRRRGDRMSSAISGTPRSGPQAVQEARSARLEEPVLDGRGPGRTGRSGEVHEARDVAEDVAENVSLRGLRGRRRLPARSPMQKKFGAKDREASFLGRFRRFSAALARGRPGRGARAPQRSEERRGPRPGVRGRSASASDAASAGPTLPLKYGLARLSPATTPGRGAQLASTRGACGGARARADPRSECGAGSFRQALQRPRGARTTRPRLCRPTPVMT